MDLKVGDLVAFKNYEDMTDEEKVGISRENFPEFGEIESIFSFTENIKIKGSSYVFPKKSIDYIIAKEATNDIHVGDEVLVKATVNSTHDNVVWLEPLAFKDDVVEVLKRKEEHFIVQEDHYGMYVNGSEVLVVNKGDAKIFDSRSEANEVAADMHLNSWEVIPYDN